jgi:hypothetical protein
MITLLLSISMYFQPIIDDCIITHDVRSRKQGKQYRGRKRGGQGLR